MTKLNLIKLAGNGAFGDVWEATDEFGRQVAVKIIRPAQVDVANALAHAKALARVTHPNVVTVHRIGEVADPTNGCSVDCVVMEFIRGETFADRLKVGGINGTTAIGIGRELIGAIQAIHSGGIVHGDLHEENVMLTGNTVKVIDILYLNSLALASTEIRQKKLSRDLTSLRFLIHNLISTSDFGPSKAKDFNNALQIDPSIEQLLEALNDVGSKGSSQTSQENCAEVLGYLIDPTFDESPEYRSVVLDRTNRLADTLLIQAVADQKIFAVKHAEILRLLWKRLDKGEKSTIGNHIGNILNKDLPNGNWSPVLRMVSCVGKEVWNVLPNLTKIRLELLIVTDTLAGRRNIHSLKMVDGGALGTYAGNLWPQFSAKNITSLVENIISLLRQSWFTQNYVGSFFMPFLGALADASGKRIELLGALKIAITNDAKVIKQNLSKLPADWQSHLAVVES